MATHSSTLAWEIPWMRSLAGYSPWSQRVRRDSVTKTLPPSLSGHTPWARSENDSVFCILSSWGNSIGPFPTNPPSDLGSCTAPDILCSAPVNSHPLVPQQPPAWGFLLGCGFPKWSGLGEETYPSEHHRQCQLNFSKVLPGAAPRTPFLQGLPPSQLQLSLSQNLAISLTRTTHTPASPGFMLGSLPKPLVIASNSPALFSTKKVGYNWHSPLPSHLYFTDNKESTCNEGDTVHLLVAKIPWRREWKHIPIFLPGEFHGQRSLVDYSPWGCKQSTQLSD